MDDAPFMDGWRANLQGWDVGQCPYDERYQSWSHDRWITGWCARHDAAKHGRDLSRDDR